MNDNTTITAVQCAILDINEPDDSDEKITLMHNEVMTKVSRHVQWSGAVRVTPNQKLQLEWLDGVQIGDEIAAVIGYEEVKK